jgi:hypothetical protein
VSRLPPSSVVRVRDTHRLIASKYSDPDDSVLARIAPDQAVLDGLFDLDHATNDRLLAENQLLPGIGIDELVFGVPYFRIVNAAFCHAHPLGSRFNGPDRGAWYAGFDRATSQAEIAWHKTREYAEINWFTDSVTYDDYLADFAGHFADLRDAKGFAACLAPASYVASQALADTLLAEGAAGLVYPSVRRAGGTCLACFRPAMVQHVRKHLRLRFTWSGTPTPRIVVEQRY